MKKTAALFFLFCLSSIIFSFPHSNVKAYGECSQYGPMAIYDGLDSCTCMVGYSFGTDFLGKKSCIDDNQLCREQLGFGARYNSLYDSCECGYGDIIKNGRCVDADNYCSSQYGIYSSYDSYSKRCECDDDYTLSEYGQCVEKENNVYFTLKELDTDNKKAIIRSDYDYGYYLVSYNSGCYSSSFSKYLNDQIVVNLGTDLYLDTWDKIILQDDNETCDITHKEKVDSSATLFPEEEIIYTASLPSYYIDIPSTETSPKTVPHMEKEIKKTDVVIQKETQIKNQKIDSVATSQDSNQKENIKPEPEKKLKWYQKIFNWFKRK